MKKQIEAMRRHHKTRSQGMCGTGELSANQPQKQIKTTKKRTRGAL